jgi:ATP-dependent RNA helicase SUPV3L1/SUV3
MDDDEVIAKLEKVKEETIKRKYDEIEEFLKHIQESKHHYLTEKEIYNTLKSMPPESLLYHAPIPFDTIESILINISDKYEVFESKDHIIIEKREIP